MRKSSADVAAGDGYEPPEQFRSIITSTVNKLLRAADPKFDAADGWELIKTKNGVTMHRKRAEKVKGERAIATIRGTGLVRCEPGTYVELATDLGQRRKLWDPVFVQGKVVELVDECTSIVWMELRSKKCVMEVHRDVLYMQHSRRLGQTHVVASRSAGVLQALVPCPSGALRATLHTSGYVVRPMDEERGTCEVTYVVQFDAGGPVPTALLNRISEDLPQCIARQRTAYANLYGGGGGGGGGGGVAMQAAEEEDDEDEEVPVSGDVLADEPLSPQLQPQLLKSQSVSLPLRIGAVRGSLSDSLDSLSLPGSKSPKGSPRIGSTRTASPRAEAATEEVRVSPRAQSAKALPQPPASPRSSAARPATSEGVSSSPRPLRADPPSPRPPPASPRTPVARPLPQMPPLATASLSGEPRTSPMPSPRGVISPRGVSPRAESGPLPPGRAQPPTTAPTPPPTTAPTPPPRHN